MKGRKEDFTSVVGLLIKAGHVGYKVNLQKPVGSFLRAKKDYIWFPSLQIIVAVDTNMTWQVRRDETGWHYRVNRKNPWRPISGAHGTSGGREFAQLIEVEYTKYINQIMTGEPDVIPERRSLQGGDGRAEA